jgi:hypothetical protein
LVEHSLGKGEVISSILIIGSRNLVANMHAMTGPWLIMKWVGISIDAAYLMLLVVVVMRFRRDLSRLKGGLIWPAVLGVFISVSVSSIFEDVTIARICFVVACVIYSGGIVTLLRGLIQENHQSLLRVKAESCFRAGVTQW